MKNKFIAFLFACIMLLGFVHAAARSFQHPGITYNASDILRIKALINAGTEPFYSAYNAMRQSGFVTRDASTEEITIIENDDQYNGRLGLPGRCALDNALLYQITGNDAYARKAVKWINSVSQINTLNASTVALSLGKVSLIVEAAELMRDYSGWASADKSRFDNMLRTLFYPRIKEFDRGRWGNQGLTAARAIIAMGIYLDDEGMYDHAYRYLNALPRNMNTDKDPYPLGEPTQRSEKGRTDYVIEYNAPTTYGKKEYIYDEALPYFIFDNGQCSESCRDQGHVQYGLSLYGNIAEMAWNQGDDLFGAFDNRILLGCEWTYRYNLDLTWQPTGYVTEGATFDNGKFYTLPTRSKRWASLKPYDGDRGADYSCGLNRELLLAHYAVRAGLPADRYKYLKKSVDKMIAEHGYEQGDVEAGGHYYEFPGWGTLTKRRGAWQAGDPVKDGKPYIHSVREKIGFVDIDKSILSNATHSGIEVSANGIAMMQKDGWASYTVNIPTEDDYEVIAEYDSEKDVSIAVATDGGSYTAASLPYTKTRHAVCNIHLSAGIHVVRFKATSGTNALLRSFSIQEPGTLSSAVFNETKEIGYSDILAAVSAADDGDVIIVNESQVLNSAIDVSKALTIKAGGTGVSLKRGDGNNGLVVLARNNAQTNLMLEGLTLDGCNRAVAGNFVEASGTTTLKNCVITGNVTSSMLGAVCTKGGAGRLIIDGCTFCRNSVTYENGGILFNGASLALKGDVIFTDNDGHDIYLENRYLTAASGDILWTTPISLYYKTPEENKVIIGGGAWGKGLTAFKVANDGWNLYMKENSPNGDILLTQTKPTAVNNVTIYPDSKDSKSSHSSTIYTISGQRTNALAKGLLIKNGKTLFIKR